ncbi:hypothetical protein [Catenovulum sediminis]|uniref:YtxH domain-containing protein n=1 Tax=Catenovulum sediminis TaxID=1740262 RepID=A0ABV1RJY4_9ALTE|nr:hypothetical protein [Catenovulum sediminis]
MKTLLKTSAVVFSLLAALSLTGCDDGGAENMGEEIDRAVDNTGEKIEDAATDAGNAIEDACEDVKEGVDAKDKDC